MPQMRLFARLTKVDAAKREVWGRLTQEIPDNAGEIMDYESSKPFFRAWSEDFQKNTDGKSLGNVRAMHGQVAAGKLIAIDFNDDDKAVDIGTKIIDDNEMEKCLEGVYTGFSVGGKYGKKWADPMTKLTRYTAKPGEASLVDKPCVPTAKFFEVIKMDGSKSQVQFKTPEAAVDELARMLNTGEISPVALVQLAKKAKDDGEEDDDDDEEDLEKPEEVSQEDWDAMSQTEKEEAIAEYEKKDGGKTAETVAEHNKKVEAMARDLCKKHFETLKSEEKAMRQPDADWQNFVPEATREIAKLEKREFSEGERKEAAKEGEALPDGSYPIKNVSDLENAVQAYGRAKDKPEAKAHIISRAKALGATDKLPEDWEGSTKEKTEKKDNGDLKKGLSNVKTFADCLMMLGTIFYSARSDAMFEGDNSPVPQALQAWIGDGAAIFKEMAEEEVDELCESLAEGVSNGVMAMAERSSMHKALETATGSELLGLAVQVLGKEGVLSAVADLDLTKDRATDVLRKAALTKYGARHSADDMGHLQQAHDCLAKLGAMCKVDSGAQAGRPGADTAQGPAAQGADLGNAGADAVTTVKGDGMGDKLKIATLEKTIANLTQLTTDQGARLKKLEDQPLPMKGKLRAVGKGEDAVADEPMKKVVESTPGKHNPEAAVALIKSAVLETSSLRKY